MYARNIKIENLNFYESDTGFFILDTRNLKPDFTSLFYLVYVPELMPAKRTFRRVNALLQ